MKYGWSHFKLNIMNEVFNFPDWKVFINENELGKMNFDPLGILCIPQTIWS